MEETPQDTAPPGPRRPRRLPRQNGPAIRALREKDGWTQTALAKAAGIQQCTLSLIESENASATMPTLNRLARKLRVPVDAIMRDRDDTEDVSDPDPEELELARPEGAAA